MWLTGVSLMLCDHLSGDTGADVQTSEGEEVLWNRINWQEVAWGLGGRQRNRPGSCYYTDLNPQGSFPTATNAQTLYCMIATLHSCKTHSYVQLVVYQSDIFRNNVPRAVFAADTAVTGLWLVSCVCVSCPSLGVGRKHRKRLSLGASKVDSAVNKNAFNNTGFLCGNWKAGSHLDNMRMQKYFFHNALENRLKEDLKNNPLLKFCL